MQNPFLYNGRGLPLRAASSAGVVTDPEILDIPNGGYSEGFAGHDALEVLADIAVNNANAGGDVLLEHGDTQTFTNVATYATITTTGARVGSYKSGGPINGFFRFKNNSGQTIKIFLQKRIN